MIKILAVDDDLDELISLKAIINNCFPKSILYFAIDGKTGIELAIENDLDVILLDVIMSDIDGYKVCKKIKSDYRLKDTPIIFLTPMYVDRDIRMRALKCGADAYLTRPIDEIDLITQIQAMAKIKTANVIKLDEKFKLAALVDQKTKELKKSNNDTLKLIDVLRLENEARKKSEEALQNSYTIFSKFMEHSPIYVFFKDENIRTISLSKNYEAMLGQPIDKLLGKNMNELFPSELAEKMVQDDIQILNEGKEITVNEVFNGRHYITIKFPIHEQDKPKYLAGFTIDITEQKLAEERLTESEERYRTLIEGAPDAFFQGDKNGNFITINDKAIEYTGYSKTELLKMNMCNLFQAEVLDLTPLRYDLLKQGSTVITEREITRKYGEKLFVEMNTKGMSDGTFQCFMRDITERKQAEAKLKESEEKFAKVFRDAPVLIAITDLESGIYLEVNEYTLLVSGFTREEVIGHTAAEIGWISADEQEQLAQKILEKGNLFDYEMQFCTKSGKIITGLVNGEEFIVTGRKALLTISIDITERKQVEFDLLNAKKRSEESDYLKSTFLANMSHEIRTPLNCILGFSELLADPDRNHVKQVKYLKLINTSGKNLLSIINNIIDISKIEAEQIEINKSVFSAIQLINQLKDEFEYKALEKGILLIIDPKINKMKYLIESDENKIRQVLTNLIINAIKFTKIGIIKIGLKKDGTSVKFYVKDTGIGIPKEFYDNLFQRFRQLEKSQTRKYGGNGLGLAISKSLIEMLGGQIWVESIVGKGSTFYFTIPTNY